MLRSFIISRNQLIKSAVKRNVRNQVTRGLTTECVRRRHNQRSLTQNKLEAKPLIWNQYTVRGYADYPPHTVVNLPALSPTMETGTIISWAKKEGDKLNEGDLLAEIETDKATMGFETPEEGYLAKILAPAGSKDVPIGKLVCIITENKEDVAKFQDFKDTGAAAPPPKKASSPPPKAATPPPASPQPVAAAPPLAAATPAPVAPAHEGGRVLASPMAKRLAEIRNVRLQGKGSGIFGSIKVADVGAGGPAAAQAPQAAQGVAGPSGAKYTDTPIPNIRAVIAKRLTESKVTIPHYYLSKDVNVEKLIAFREKVNKQLEKQKLKISINDLVIKAVAAASTRVPIMNQQWLGNVIRQYHSVDVSVAVSTDKGLITPIIFDADRKGVVQISKEMKILAAKARENKLQPAEFQGGTITVSNLGMFDVPVFAAIINPPQAGIVAVGSLAKKIVACDEPGTFKEAPFISVTLSADHRIADGAVGAQWLKILADNLSDPENMCL